MEQENGGRMEQENGGRMEQENGGRMEQDLEATEEVEISEVSDSLKITSSIPLLQQQQQIYSRWTVPHRATIPKLTP